MKSYDPGLSFRHRRPFMTEINFREQKITGWEVASIEGNKVTLENGGVIIMTTPIEESKSFRKDGDKYIYSGR